MRPPPAVRMLFLSLFLCALLPRSPAAAGGFATGGYWENWNPPLHPGSGSSSDPACYENDMAPFNHIYYSFLTLVQVPDPYAPPDQPWDGQALYESMTQADVITVMTRTDPPWDNPYEWQRVKIQAMIDQCTARGKRFIWAIGGWSDLTRTLSDEQIPAFVDRCVALLELAGDGIDFDWEHLSEHAEIRDQQRRVLGKIFPALRQALDAGGLSGKRIGYTTRFNAFWNDANRPAGVAAFISDGEGIDVVQAIADAGSTVGGCLDWVNVMMYDVPPGDLGYPGGFTLDAYTMVLGLFDLHVPKNLTVMGFEPGGQAAGGVWEGMAVDRQVIDYLEARGYGGVMFWAANQPASGGSPEVTGENAQALARYAARGGAAARVPAAIVPLLLSSP